MTENYICTTCGVQQTASPTEPARCLICEDERQYVNWEGQTWTTLTQMQGKFRNEIIQVEPNLYSIQTVPRFAIAQKAYLIQSSSGNILWDCVTLLDTETINNINHLGGITAIAISHPHYYSTMVNWSQAFGRIPIYVHAQDKQWVLQPDEAIQYWNGKRKELPDNLQLICCGGHFPGASVLFWPAGANHSGVIFSGDTLQVAMNRQSVSFMYSYPNLIPLRRAEIIGIQQAMADIEFDRLYGAFDPHINQNARQALNHSITRYLKIYE